MKNKKTPIFILVVILLLAIPFSLASCMEKEDYYTKEDISSLVSTLENKIAQNKSDYEAALEELTAEYETKQAVLDAEDKANADAIAKLEEDYKAAVAELEATYSEKIATIETLVTALSETSLDNTEKIAALEAQVEELLSRHEHAFGEWINYVGNENVYCENRLFYRICTKCNVLEWKSGTYDNHSFSTVTTPPTCVSMGYDTKTCSICGKIEKINETPISDHIWKNNYSYNNSFHWIDCNYCDAEKEKAEHTTDESGYCTVCDKPVGATEGIIYEISSDGAYASVVGYDGTAMRVKIADMYEGVPVTELCESVFEGKNIVSVIIPDSVTSIGNSAFYNCTSLTSVHISDIAAWCNISFVDGYSNPLYYAKNLYLNGNLVTELVIPNSVTSIGNSAFYNCTSLTSVTIGNGVTSIGSSAFEGCSSLTSVTIGNSVKSIGSEAFRNCTSLTSVTIPGSVTSIGNGAFWSCTSLTSVTIGNSVTSIGSDAFSYCNSALYTEYEYGKYVGDENNPYAVLIELSNKNLSTYTINENTKIIGSGVFRNCARLTNITIPDSVTTIGGDAFRNCDSLTSVVIGNSVTSIGERAFCNCDSLTSVTIPGSVTSIGERAFYNCTSLTSVVIPGSVTSIGNGAFEDCTSLTSVTIGNGVTSIGSSAFWCCTSLTSIKYRGTDAQWNDISKGYNWNCSTGNYTITYNYTDE